MLTYTVTITDLTASGHGWRVACVGTPDAPWDALGRHITPPTRHRTQEAAMKRAEELARTFNAIILGRAERPHQAELLPS